MLSAKAIKSVKQASHYFFEQDNYYLKDAPELQESAQWWGEGSERLGLSGEVTKEQFNELLCGKLPNGQQLGKRVDGEIKHRPGFDLTFSAPKSVSILAEIGRDTRLHQAHTEAVHEALAYVQKLCAQARITTLGKTTYEQTENLVVAKFTHDTSRSLDPLLHTHSVVLNMTQRHDGQWRALASATKNNPDMATQGFLERVFENQRFLGAIYRASLAHKVQNLGYTVEKTHSDGRFEIVEVPKEIIQHFSGRREDIKKFLEEHGMQGARASSYAALETRQSKQEVDRKVLHKKWQERAASLEFDVQSTIQHAIEKTNSSDIKSIELSDAVANQAVHFAIDHLSERDTTLSHHRVLNLAVTHAIGTTTPNNIIQAINKAIKDGHLIPLQSKDDEARYTTQTLLSYEQEMLTHVGKQAYSVMPIAHRESFIEIARESLLTREQQTAVVDLFDSHDRTVALQGASGTGKSTWMIPKICQIAEIHGWKSKVLTPSTAAAQKQGKLGNHSQTVSGFIQEADKAISLKKTKDFQKTYLVVDDASMLSARQIRDLQRLSEQLDNRLILVGDNKSYLPFEGGSPFEHIQQAGLKTAHLTQLLRQQDKTHVAAIEDTLLGDIKAAFSKMASRIMPIDDRYHRLQSMAQHYANLSLQERKETLLLLPTRSQCDTANLEVRALLKQRNELRGDSIHLTVLNPKSLTTAQTTSAHHYLTGDVVRFNQAQRKLNVLPGNYYTVVSTDTTKNQVTVQNDKGDTLNWNPLATGGKRHGAIEVFTTKSLAINQGDIIRFSRNQKDAGLHNGEKLTVAQITADKMMVQRQDGQQITLSLKENSNKHFDYGYAITPYQGYHEEPKQVIAHQESQTPLTTQRSFYKQLSQAKESVWLYTDEVQAFLQTVEKQTGNRVGAMNALLQGNTLVFDPTHPPQVRVEQLMNQVADVITRSDLRAFVGEKAIEAMALDATHYAMQHLAEREAAFTHKELLQTALTHALGTVTPQQIEQSIQQVEQAGHLLKNTDTHNVQWTTREAVQLEHAILKMVENGKGQLLPIAESKQIDDTLAETRLTDGQKSAVRLITSTSDNLVLVQGYAGTGKTTMLQAAQSVLEQARDNKIAMLEATKTLCEQAGFNLHGLAPSHTAVYELQSRGIQAQTLDSFLVEIQRMQREKSIPDYSRTVFVLDEASMVSNRKFHDIQAFCLQQKAKLAALGDTEQLSSPESGKPFALTQKIGTPTAYMTEIKRQMNNPTLLGAVQATYKKDFSHAFELLSTHKTDLNLKEKHQPTEKSPLGIVEITNKYERLNALAEDYLNRPVERRASTIIITPANKDRVTVNTLIREGLREEGILSGRDRGIQVLVARNFTEAERTRVTNYQQNDTVRFNQSINSLGVNKNSYFKVTAIDKANNLLTLENEVGKHILLQPNRLAGRGTFEVYEAESRVISIGDNLRFTRSDKEKGIFAGTLAKVVAIAEDGKLTLSLPTREKVATKESKTTLITDSHKDAILDMKLPENQHIDHGYAMTTHMSQGKTKEEVLSHHESTSKMLATQKNVLVAITRAELTVTLYTDNKAELIKQIEQHTGEKTSALETIGYRFNVIDKQAENKADSHTALSNKQVEFKQTKPQYDLSEIQQRLEDSAEKVVENLLGKPSKTSTNTYRYGSQKGSLVVTLKGEKRGYWYDFQTGEGGNLITLIGKTLGHHPQKDFLQTIEYAAKLTGVIASNLDSKKQILPSQKISKKVNKSKVEFTDYQKKRVVLAHKIERESLPIEGTLAERYLREHRGITCKLPESLRFHPGIYISQLKKTIPALIVIAKNEANKTQAIQTIYLDRETAKKADIEPNKTIIAPIKGALVTLQEGRDKNSPTLIAEGIETALSLKMANKNAQIKATLGVSNYLNIPTHQVNQTVIFCLDNDGQKSMSETTAHKGMKRLQETGKTLFYNQPDRIKTDYNDVLKQHGLEIIKDKINESKHYHPSHEKSQNYQQYQKTNELKNNLISKKLGENISNIKTNNHIQKIKDSERDI